MRTPPGQRDRLEQARERSAASLGWVRTRLARGGYVRPSSGRLLAGVLVGLGRRFDLSPWLLRGLFVVSFLLPGPQFVVYVALWLAMPSEADLPSPDTGGTSEPSRLGSSEPPSGGGP